MAPWGCRLVKFKQEACPNCRGWAIGQGKGPFKCRKCGHVFTPKRGNKYHAEKSTVGSTVFDSKAEKRYLTEDLAWRLKAGEITNLVIKPRYELEPGIHYKPEATYLDVALGHPVTVEVKGSSTKGGRFPTIVNIWRNHMDHPLHIVEYDYRGKRFVTTRKIMPRGKGAT
jgi:hypothetical protein